ncbi:hypothetical protein BJV82DRAFT_200370 [Fennellomyces sp. T-0311]|nr:hypothetical protein BJV82DRAFT_200370 [Fennellomyces sp. T-0311]
MIGFYTRAVDCDDAEALQQHYGQVPHPYATCVRHREMIRASRIYFIITCINFIFVVVTTAIFVCIAHNAPHNYYTSPPDPQRPGRRRLFRRWQRTSLQRRSIFGTALGACGHLVFSSAALLSQTFYGEATCELYMWGVIMGFYTWIYALCWRAYRLYFLIRLNSLKTRYASRHGGEQPRPCSETDRQHKWLMRNVDCRAIRVARPLAMYMMFFVIIVIVCVLFETKRLTCEDRWGVCILLSFVGFFIFIVAPSLMWRLKGYNDAHGIRNEILIDVVAGVIFSILTLVWYLKLNRPRPRFGPHYRYFAPRTWLVFFTTTAHLTSVVWPIWQLIPEWRKSRHDSEVPASAVASADESDADTGLQQTPETLERLLRDPVAAGSLVRLAVQDFSSENVLAYKEYLRLVDCLQTQKYGRVIKRFSQRFHSSATTLVGEANSEEKNDDLLRLPIESPRLLDDFTNFYDTYIRQGAPLQVNISYKARSELDSFFKRRLSHSYDEGETVTDLITPWSHKPAPLLPVHTSRTTRLSWGSETLFPRYPSSTPEPQLTLAKFEPARNELFWNIFASVFAKYIRSHQ